MKNPENAMVIGRGFDHLEEILEIFNTIFLFSFGDFKFRAKNVVMRENFEDLNPLSNISMILMDRDQVQHLEKLVPIWNRCNPVVIIEGGDAIGREFSFPLYQNNYRCVELQGFFHVWKKIE